MGHLSASYEKNVEEMRALLRAEESFDIIERRLCVGQDEMTLFYIDGFVKDGVLQRLMQYFIGLKDLCGDAAHPCRRFEDCR